MSEWQPISTAPKFKHVIAWRDDAGWFAAYYGHMEGWLVFSDRDDVRAAELTEEELWKEGWWLLDESGATRLEGDLVPTLWMEPEAPKVSA